MLQSYKYNHWEAPFKHGTDTDDKGTDDRDEVLHSSRALTLSYPLVRRVHYEYPQWNIMFSG